MNIKTLLLAASLATALITAPALQANTEVIDQVVAIVDDDIIMASELRERVTAVTENLKARDVQQIGANEKRGSSLQDGLRSCSGKPP